MANKNAPVFHWTEQGKTYHIYIDCPRLISRKLLCHGGLMLARKGGRRALCDTCLNAAISNGFYHRDPEQRPAPFDTMSAPKPPNVTQAPPNATQGATPVPPAGPFPPEPEKAPDPPEKKKPVFTTPTTIALGALCGGVLLIFSPLWPGIRDTIVPPAKTSTVQAVQASAANTTVPLGDNDFRASIDYVILKNDKVGNEWSVYCKQGEKIITNGDIVHFQPGSSSTSYARVTEYDDGTPENGDSKIEVYYDESKSQGFSVDHTVTIKEKGGGAAHGNLATVRVRITFTPAK